MYSFPTRKTFPPENVENVDLLRQCALTITNPIEKNIREKLKTLLQLQCPSFLPDQCEANSLPIRISCWKVPDKLFSSGDKLLSIVVVVVFVIADSMPPSHSKIHALAHTYTIDSGEPQKKGGQKRILVD